MFCSDRSTYVSRPNKLDASATRSASSLLSQPKSASETSKRKVADIPHDFISKKKVSNLHPSWSTLKPFTFVKILSDDAQSKTLRILAKANTLRSESNGEDPSVPIERQLLMNCEGDGDSRSMPDEDAHAILILEKTPFGTMPSDMEDLLSTSTSLEQIFNNDIYGTYVSHPPPSSNCVKTVVIFPATAKHIEKYQACEGHVIYETAADYRDITLPYLQISTFDMQWIYNILEKKKESEFIIYEDPHPVNGYLLLPDLKWDRKSLDNLYISAIVHRRGIKSLRDLTDEHLPLLRNIQKTALTAIEDKYGVSSSKIRAYFHYQPSYYHLHVHFNQIKNIAAGSNVLGSHLLSDVIDNIQMQSDYYQKKSLAFISRENALLYKCFLKADRIGKL